MQIAVASVKNIGAAEPELTFHLLDAAQHPTDLPARNGAVHAVIVR